MAEQQVRVGLGVIIVKKTVEKFDGVDLTVGRMLVGRRKGSHGAGRYSFPGGHLDFNEEWAACALREVEEECGEGVQLNLLPKSPTQLEWFVTNDILPEDDRHYITIYIAAEWVSGEPINREPNKCEGWQWLTFDELERLEASNKTAWVPLERLREVRLDLEV